MKNKFYRFEVYCSTSSGDSEYIAKYFDLPIIGSGKTIEEAIEEAQGNLEVYLDYCTDKGISIPVPTLPEGMAEYSGKITLRISKTLHERIVTQAKREGISINAFLNESITTYVTSREAINSVYKETARELSRITMEKALEIFNCNYRFTDNICDYDSDSLNNITMKYTS